MTRWQRVGPMTVAIRMSVLFIAAGLLGMTAFFLGWIDGGAVAGVSLVIFTAMAARWHFRGVYVNDRGVRSRWFFATLTLAWADIEGFDVQPVSRMTLLATIGSADMHVQTIRMIAKNGDTAELPLWFQRAQGLEPANGDSWANVLSAEQGKQALAQLRESLVTAGEP